MNLIAYREHHIHFQPPHESVTQFFIQIEERDDIKHIVLKYCIDEGKMIPDWVLITSVKPLKAYTGAWMFKNYLTDMVDISEFTDNYILLEEFASGLSYEDLKRISKEAIPYS